MEAINDIFGLLSPSYSNRQIPANFVSSPLASLGESVKNRRPEEKCDAFVGGEDEKSRNESYSFMVNFLVMWPLLFSHT